MVGEASKSPASTRPQNVRRKINTRARTWDLTGGAEFGAALEVKFVLSPVPSRALGPLGALPPEPQPKDRRSERPRIHSRGFQLRVLVVYVGAECRSRM
jgi:hypothetical protein